MYAILSRFSKKYRHISKTRVFEKRFSQLHCVICPLFSVKNWLSMSQMIFFKNNFSKLIVIAFECFHSKKFSALCLFYQGFLKYRHISKTRVFEKRFSQLHCVICCLFTVKNSLSMSQTMSCKSNISQTDCYCLRMFPYEAIFRVLSVLSRFFETSPQSKTRVFRKRFSQLHCVICCLFTVKKLLSMSHTIPCKSNIS